MGNSNSQKDTGDHTTHLICVRLADHHSTQKRNSASFLQFNQLPNIIVMLYEELIHFEKQEFLLLLLDFSICPPPPPPFSKGVCVWGGGEERKEVVGRWGGITTLSSAPKTVLIPWKWILGKVQFYCIHHENTYIVLTPLNPHFYRMKMEFTGVYINLLISAQKYRLWVLIRTASLWQF